MNKAALLIGVSEYNSESGLKSLPSAAEDVQAMQRVLLHSSEFSAEDITVLTNPQKHDVEEAIYKLFADRQKEDLLLFYFSGHGIKDETGKLYFSLPTTRKNQNGSLMKYTALPATVLHESMNDSRSTCQVLVLDCCFSGAFAKGLTVKDDGNIDIRAQLGGKGRAIFTSSNSIEYSFHQDNFKLSVYTHFFVEGLETGAADLDSDGLISADEMHTYLSEKVKQAAPKMTPQFFPGEQGYKIYLARSIKDDLKKKIERELKLPFFDQLVELVRKRIKSLSDTQIAYYVGVIITGIEERFVLRNKENFSDEQSFTFWFLSKGLAQLDLSRQKKIIGHIQCEEFEHGDFTLVAIHDLITAAGGVRGDHYDQEGDSIAPSNEGWKLLDRIFKSDELTTLRNSLTSENNEFFAFKVPLTYYKSDLTSERGVDYTRLANLLKAGKWKTANYETYLVMLNVWGRREGDWVRAEEIENFPCADLRTINKLWIKYSDGHFGFSIQKEIYLKVGGQLNGEYNEDIWESFGERVGWRRKEIWIQYAQVDFDTNRFYDSEFKETSDTLIHKKQLPYVPRGHLPWGGVFGVPIEEVRRGFKGWFKLFPRIETCNQ
jgi:GUN4-like/Caspase domain